MKRLLKLAVASAIGALSLVSVIGLGVTYGFPEGDFSETPQGETPHQEKEEEECLVLILADLLGVACTDNGGETCDVTVGPRYGDGDAETIFCPGAGDETCQYAHDLFQKDGKTFCPDPTDGEDDKKDDDKKDDGEKPSGGNLTSMAGSSSDTSPEARTTPRRPQWQPAPVQRHPAFSAPSGGWTPQPARPARPSRAATPVFSAPSSGWSISR